jgi:hypothetical protein
MMPVHLFCVALLRMIPFGDESCEVARSSQAKRKFSFGPEPDESRRAPVAARQTVPFAAERDEMRHKAFSSKSRQRAVDSDSGGESSCPSADECEYSPKSKGIFTLGWEALHNSVRSHFWKLNNTTEKSETTKRAYSMKNRNAATSKSCPTRQVQHIIDQRLCKLSVDCDCALSLNYNDYFGVS